MYQHLLKRKEVDLQAIKVNYAIFYREIINFWHLPQYFNCAKSKGSRAAGEEELAFWSALFRFEGCKGSSSPFLTKPKLQRNISMINAFESLPINDIFLKDKNGSNGTSFIVTKNLPKSYWVSKSSEN